MQTLYTATPQPSCFLCVASGLTLPFPPLSPMPPRAEHVTPFYSLYSLPIIIGSARFRSAQK